MVARTPPKQRKVLAALNPHLIRETVNKVDRCMARLQELQYTVSGGTKVVSGVNLSPRSTRGYLRTSLRCKQESIRTKNGGARKSPVGKFPTNTGGEWRRMSLPAMLVGETVGEILQATQFARQIVSVVSKSTATEDPKTPVSQRSNQKVHPENTQLKDRRKKEKRTKPQSIRSESKSPSLQRARSRINFKVSPPKVGEFDKENNRYLANRVSPRNRPWAKKTVLFPNPLFLSTSSQQPQRFSKTGSPVISKKKETPHKILMKSPSASRKRETPHKFLIKSPPSASKFQVRVKSPPIVSFSPSRPTSLSKGSPVRAAASKLRRSFSPSRLATRLISPLKNKRSAQKSDGLISGLKQRPGSTTVQFPARTVKP